MRGKLTLFERYLATVFFDFRLVFAEGPQPLQVVFRFLILRTPPTDCENLPAKNTVKKIHRHSSKAMAQGVATMTFLRPSNPFSALLFLSFRGWVSGAVLDKQSLLNAQSFWDNQDWDWYKKNIPFFSCPDEDITTTYYYRWELVTKHLNLRLASQRVFIHRIH